jgi:hypothetical protein
MSTTRKKIALPAGQKQNPEKLLVPQSKPSTDLTHTVQRMQQGAKPATSAELLMLQRTLGNHATLQLLRPEIQREGDSEEESEQEEVNKVDVWTRQLEKHEQLGIDLRAALKDGDYDEANSIFQQVLNITSIIKAKTSVKQGFSANLKLLGSVISGRGQGTRTDRLRIMDINNRYNILAKEIDRLAKKYHQIPQVYDAISAYLNARSTGETITEQNI